MSETAKQEVDRRLHTARALLYEVENALDRGDRIAMRSYAKQAEIAAGHLIDAIHRCYFTQPTTQYGRQSSNSLDYWNTPEQSRRHDDHQPRRRT